MCQPILPITTLDPQEMSLSGRRKVVCITAVSILAVSFDGLASFSPGLTFADASSWQTVLDISPEHNNNNMATINRITTVSMPKLEANTKNGTSADSVQVQSNHEAYHGTVNGTATHGSTNGTISGAANGTDVRPADNINRSVNGTTNGMSKGAVRRMASPLHNSVASSWADVAPVVECGDSLPKWITDYVSFHNNSLAKATSAKEDKNSYLIYTCTKSNSRTSFCSGTGNRQGAIAAMYVVAMLTGRVLLIDMDNPVALSSVLQPNLIQWNAIPDYLDEMPSVFLNLRKQNGPANRPDLNVPSNWTKGALPQVVRVLASKPANLHPLWKTRELRSHLESEKKWLKKEIRRLSNKYIFFSLFRPSHALAQTVAENRRLLGFNSMDDSYMSIHLRLGAGIGETPHHGIVVTPSAYLEAANNTSRANNSSDTPIVIISDTAPVKPLLYEMNPSRVRYVNNTVLHMDLNKNTTEPGMLEAALNVWADVLILAQSKCLVMSHGTFSRLALWISEPEEGERCRDDSLVGEG